MNGKSAEDLRISRSIVGVVRTQDLSGFEVWQWLGPVHGNSGELSECNLYPTLYKLEAEGFIRSSWHEDDRARRKYRITATGKRRAEAEGWGPIAARRFRSAPTVSGRRTTHEDDEEWNWSEDEILLPGDEHLPPGSPEAAAVDAYMEKLCCELLLDPLHFGDVKHEIEDHIADSSGRRHMAGATATDAVADTLEALGPADDLARAINDAQMSAGRLRGGIGWGFAVAITTTILSFAAFYLALTVGIPILVAVVSVVAYVLGLHLYAPVTAEWGSENVAAAACAAAFFSASRSMPALAERSRRCETYVWKTWAITGGIPVAIIAGLIPGSLDPLTVGVLAAIPAAWVLGTRRPISIHGDTVTARGLALGAALISVAMILPGGRIWDFDPAATATMNPPRDPAATAAIDWQGDQKTASRQATVVDMTPGWTDPTVEIWAADRFGPFVVPNTSSPTPAMSFSSGGVVDFDSLPRDRADWWVTVTAVGPDGHRHVVHNEVHFGDPAQTRSGIIFLLLGQLSGR